MICVNVLVTLLCHLVGDVRTGAVGRRARRRAHFPRVTFVTLVSTASALAERNAWPDKFRRHDPYGKVQVYRKVRG